MKVAGDKSQEWTWIEEKISLEIMSKLEINQKPMDTMDNALREIESGKEESFEIIEKQEKVKYCWEREH